ncbi:MAG: 3-deoxy-7-phosphoheptulonate synthase [Anaerolineaceae bacterium]|nr:3-deoxy-7-phosphoheptulonate synthase [Anaerolineaceae bacterium]
MMIIMNTDAEQKQVDKVVKKVKALGFDPHIVDGEERTVVGVGGNNPFIATQGHFSRMPGVDRILPISRPYKLCSREFIPEDSSFPLDGIHIGGRGIVIIAGPCAVEDRGLLLEIAHAIKEAGAHALRGGAFKPRTSPYSFQGHGEKALKWLAEAREASGLPIVTEAMSIEQIKLVAEYADVIQIGARNMQNYSLLHAAGASQHPVLLKRGMSSTVEELLMAAEYILSHDNRRVILCERGIRTFERSTRNTTDINAIPVLKSLTHLPVILDPSHATGNWKYVTAVARAGIAAGADGLIVEVHTEPENALSDGFQSLKPERFAAMVTQIRNIAQAIDRDIAASTHADPAAK